MHCIQLLTIHWWEFRIFIRLWNKTSFNVSNHFENLPSNIEIVSCTRLLEYTHLSSLNLVPNYHQFCLFPFPINYLLFSRIFPVVVLSTFNKSNQSSLISMSVTKSIYQPLLHWSSYICYSSWLPPWHTCPMESRSFFNDTNPVHAPILDFQLVWTLVQKELQLHKWIRSALTIIDLRTQ